MTEINLCNKYIFDNIEGKACNTNNCDNKCSNCYGWYKRLKIFNNDMINYINDFLNVCAYVNVGVNFPFTRIYTWCRTAMENDFKIIDDNVNYFDLSEVRKSRIREVLIEIITQNLSVLDREYRRLLGHVGSPEDVSDEETEDDDREDDEGEEDD